MCPRSSDPFKIVKYYIKWVTTVLAHSIENKNCQKNDLCKENLNVGTGTLLEHGLMAL